MVLIHYFFSVFFFLILPNPVETKFNSFRVDLKRIKLIFLEGWVNHLTWMDDFFFWIFPLTNKYCCIFLSLSSFSCRLFLYFITLALIIFLFPNFSILSLSLSCSLFLSLSLSFSLFQGCGTGLFFLWRSDPDLVLSRILVPYPVFFSRFGS